MMGTVPEKTLHLEAEGQIQVIWFLKAVVLKPCQVPLLEFQCDKAENMRRKRCSENTPDRHLWTGLWKGVFWVFYNKYKLYINEVPECSFLQPTKTAFVEDVTLATVIAPKVVM